MQLQKYAATIQSESFLRRPPRWHPKPRALDQKTGILSRLSVKFFTQILKLGTISQDMALIRVYNMFSQQFLS